jgi:hypothetical protein
MSLHVARRLTFALSGILAVAACAARDAETQLRRDLAALVAADSAAQIDLARSMPIPWTYVVVVPPYSTKTTIDAVLGFSWNPRPIGRALSNDDSNALLFVANGRVRRAVVLLRRDAHFCCPAQPVRYSRADARFRFAPDSIRPRLQHVPSGTG